MELEPYVSLHCHCDVMPSTVAYPVLHVWQRHCSILHLQNMPACNCSLKGSSLIWWLSVRRQQRARPRRVC